MFNDPKIHFIFFKKCIYLFTWIVNGPKTCFLYEILI